jgi:hypothetical protein
MPHPPMPETAFVDRVKTVEDIADLRGRLITAGYSRIEVTGCVDLVVMTAVGNDPGLMPSTASHYRKMLRRLLADAGRPGPPPSKKRQAQLAAAEAKAARVKAGAKLVGVAVALAVGLRTRDTDGAQAAGLYITMKEGDELPEAA